MYHPESASHKISPGEIQTPDEKNIPASTVHQQKSAVGSSAIQHREVISGSVLGATAINTHFFDGKLASPNSSFLSLIEGDAARDIKENIDRVSQVDRIVKSEAFRKLDEFIHSQTKYSITPNATRCLRTIISTHRIHGRVPGNPNHSPSDNLHSCDLLYLLYEEIVEKNSSEHLNLLLTQLDDMATGMCQNGRTNRLFQTIVMLRNDLSVTSKPVD